MGLAERMAMIHYITVFIIVWISDSCCEGQGRSPGTSGGFHLSGPLNYTVYGGEIQVDYVIPGNVTLTRAMIQTVDVDTGVAVYTAEILSGYLRATTYMSCGVIDRAGVYVFKLLDFGGPTLVTSGYMYAVWPVFHMTLPHTHVALTTPVVMQFSYDQPHGEDLCHTLQPHTTLRLQVLYQGNQQVNSTSGVSEANFRYSEDIHNIELMRNVPKSFTCDVFDLEGSYSVALMTNSPSSQDTVIAISNIMHARWSQEYALSMRANSIFPCRSAVYVQYSNPACASSEDRIRLYMRTQVAQSSAASPTSLQYISENRIVRGGSQMRFDCNLFHESLPAYCFKYVSFASSSAITEQKTLCVPSIAGNEAVLDGQWSGWSSWSSCTVSCGRGQMSRYRTCDNPEPSPGARYCQGDNIQWQECDAPCSGGRSTTVGAMATPDPDCLCGCEVIRSSGQIVGTSRCPGSSIWVIQVDPGFTIQLTFSVFDLDGRNDNTWVKVRDGRTQMSSLLMYDFGGGLPQPLYSSRDAMLVELMMPYDQNYDTSAGFVMSFVSIASNGTAIGVPSGSSEGTVWKTIVSVLAAAILGIIVCVILIVVCQRRNQKKDLVKALQANQSLLVNGELPNSPSHSGQSNHGSTNLSYKDAAAGSPSRRDYVLAKGFSNNPNGSTDSTRHKHGSRQPHHSRQSSNSSGFRGSLNSPGSPFRSPLHSPGRADREVPREVPQNPSLFNTSPLTERAVIDHNGRHHRHKTSPRHHPLSPGGFNRHDRHSVRSIDSSSATYVEPLPRSYNPLHAPLAGGEDLSPTSPEADYANRQLPLTPSYQYRNKNDVRTKAEIIPLDNQNWHHPSKPQQETQFNSPPRQRDPTSRGHTTPGQRPPVEGRDSTLHRGRDLRDAGSSTTSMDLPTTPDYQNANVVNNNGRPIIKPLPLRSVQRPDGQSPENKPEDHNANTPSSYGTVSHDLSPFLQKEKLFPGSGSGTPAEFAVEPADFEYDDYVPELPGSYFTMDPHAYTLTWSKKPPTGHNVGSTTGTTGNIQSMGTNTHGMDQRVHESNA